MRNAEIQTYKNPPDKSGKRSPIYTQNVSYKLVFRSAQVETRKLSSLELSDHDVQCSVDRGDISVQRDPNRRLR